ncbi:hypothetical protein L3Q82_011352 [Scortum barcoo]|uniref:Uncharacterized protein n=1 Tax=Scortum barcoo TaxID=214431 RepID=A0ACB8W9X6_9TELE|nr:hypothetical protein L3Q82_011352 [Scortum barcoo]
MFEFKWIKTSLFLIALLQFTGSSSTVELIKLGQIGKRAKSKSDRLSVTANCSLVIKKVTVEDVGRYFCQQYKSGQKQGEDSQVYLSVINMNEQKDDDKVTLSCSVSSYHQCRHTVKWLYEGKDVDKDNKDLQTSQTGCYTTVSFLTSHHIYTSRLNLFTCEVTDGYTGKVQLFPFSLQSSGEKMTSCLNICLFDGFKVSVLHPNRWFT